MPTKSTRWIGPFAAVLLTGSVLAGCGDSSTPEPATATPGKPKTPALTPAQVAANKQMADMVSAVKTDSAPLVATVKFELKARPELNKPLTIRMAYIVPERIDTLSATYAADQGLAVTTTQTPAQFSAMESGVPYFHEVSVVPKANGVQYLSAVVQVKGPEEAPRIQTFFVPVVVGPPPAGT